MNNDNSLAEVDFPAAHSMDSEWFAVDKDGNIALFETGEAGIIPNHAIGADQGAVFEVLDQLSTSLGLPTEDGFDEALSEERLNKLGVFRYEYDDYGSGEPYDRTFVPKAPRKLAQLPASLQKIFGSVKFTDVSFNIDESIAPRRYFECTGWGDDM